ncbi:zf-MIZ-domain-containing protein [Hypoxylon crocopeplum]|nr:zf-MIZ-domain-containing protein [Hypoxylon crocopeplum]
MSSTSSNSDIRSLERIISTLLNKQLQTICSTHGLKTSGVKADLQNRIKNALHENLHSEPANYNAIRNTILNIRGGSSSQHAMAPSSSVPAPSQTHSTHNTYFNSYGSYTPGSMPQPSHGYANVNGSVAGGSGSGAYLPASRAPYSDNLFKNTPFYTIETRIGKLHTCAVMNSHRNSISVTLKASDFADLGRCATNLPTKIMVFCGSENVGPQDIQFPHQSEIKVNGDDIKHNLRGLKNKPGSTHPVDITPFLRLKQSNYTNNVEFTYALTTKKFYLALYVCKTHSIDELVARVKGKKISKASVIRDISKKANDPDIVATSQVLSLLCPLSYKRMEIPCRGSSCNHIQCFDAKYFMQLQEQGPTWSCPICYKPTLFESLAIDEYVQEVLQNTPESLEQVTIEPDGQWRTKTEEPEPSRSRPAVGNGIEDDDDLSILSDSHAFLNGGPVNGRNPLSTPTRSLLSGGTPNGGSRATPSTQRSGSNKRPAEVIDLTLSSDEDDEPIARPMKRQYPGPSNGLNFPPAFSNY